MNPSYNPMEVNEKLIEVPQYRSAYSDIQADIVLSGKKKKKQVWSFDCGTKKVSLQINK